MKINFTAKKRRSQKNNPKILYRIIAAVLCMVMISMSLGSSLTTFASTDDLTSIVEEDRNAELEAQTQEDVEAIYTLHLTHYLRFIVNGEGRNIQTQEILELTEADFENGLCDLGRFAYDAEQLTVTEAKPLSIDAFGENRESSAQIVYAVNSGWQIAPVNKKGNDGTVLREVFQGDLSGYEFIPADVVTVTIDYQYSKTGGLFGVSPYAPETMQALPTKDGENYEFMVPIKSKPGFNIVLDPAPLDTYLNKQPPKDATPEELHQMLDNGDFNGNITKNEVYAYQEEMNDLAAKPDYSIINKEYSNIYSTKYNRDWNDARSLRVEGADGYEAMAVCGEAASENLGQADENYGANALKDPKLKVILTKGQMENALKNGLTITVNYRRITTWYTVKHWVPESLSGLTQSEIDNLDSEKKVTVDNIHYVLLESENLQGRVGALTKAVAKTDGKVFGTLTPIPFAQELIHRIVSIGDLNQNSVDEEDKPTVIDIYYKAAESYRVIFNTDYAYIPRQQVPFRSSVKFDAVKEPERKGYIFDGWQYLKKDAVQDELTGEYGDEAYEDVPKEGGSYTLRIDEELFNKAQFKTTDGVSALYLYPKWKVDKANITVVLWTEDLDGLTDVQALAEGGNVKADGSDYYSQKYKDYKDDVISNLPVLNDSIKANNNYSNVGSFTMQVDTGSSLVDETDNLKADILNKVEEAFNLSERVDGSGFTPIQFYDYCGFEVLHSKDGEMEYLKTANADGKTAVYVYFTRKIYSLKFHYYGQVGGNPFSVAAHTSGYSKGGENCYDVNGDLIFDYDEIDIDGNDWCSADSAEAIGTPQTITVRAKYGADLRNIWPVSRPEEKIEDKDIVGGNNGKDVELISWATTLGKYRNESLPGGSHEREATIMGLFASMDEDIIADPANADQVHHLIAYWEKDYGISTYRYTHCYEVPRLDINSEGIKKIKLYNDSEELNDLLYLVPSDNEAFTKFGFQDLLPVSYDEETDKVEYSDYGQNNKTGYYAVRGYETVDDDNNLVTKYYAVARQIDTVSTNNIQSQHPSARAHMTKVNTTADHTSEHNDNEGSEWQGTGIIGSTDDPYELYYYYNRDRYTITYRVPVNRSDTSETYKELGHIELPYGTYITRDNYAFQLSYEDTNQEKTAAGEAKYLWTYPDSDPVQVCPDRDKNGVKEWKFKGWGLGPAGVNMLWKSDTGDSEPQAHIDDDFYINSDLLIYAIWEHPICNVTFHLNGGTEARSAASTDDMITVTLPANTKITETNAKIPHPFYFGYTLEGWYKADEDGKIQIPEAHFDFNDFITDDIHVAIKWTPGTIRDYSYKAYYVTDNPAKDDSTKEKIYIKADGQIAQGDTTGAKEYYILDTEESNKVCTPGTTVNLPVREFVGYIPTETNKSMTLNEENSEYYVIFYYDSYAKGSYTVRFVEAGTEYGADMGVIQQNVVFADKAVLTPGKNDVEILKNKGYQLVNRNDDGKTYTQITNYTTLKWLDSKGDIHPWSANLTDLLKEDTERTITYLVQPIEYSITYQNADNSPRTADDALSAITAENTLAENAGEKNPTLYTVKDRFTLKNPSRVYENGKWYQFSHWSLGDGITSSEQDGKIHNTLTVGQGTAGKLTFVANWVELTNIGNLKVSNTVSGNRGDINKEFTFTVTLSNTSINGTYGGMTFIDGIATFKLKHGESVTGEGIPAGTGYEVKEIDSEGYTVTSSGVADTIENGVTVVAQFNNHNHDEGAPTDPTDPTDPTNPTDPTVSTGLTDPTEPTGSTEPTDPTDLTELTKPSNPIPSDEEPPKTGDETNLALWIVLIIVSGIGIIFILVASRSQQKKEKKG